VLHELGDEEGVLVHVLAMRKGWSLSEEGELQTWAFDDPNRHPDAWVTYHYVLALPEHDPDVPYKMLFTKTGAPAAKQINTVLSRRAASGPSFMTAFRITTAKREKQLGNSTVRWTVPRVRSVDATQEGVDVSATLYQQIASSIDSISDRRARRHQRARDLMARVRRPGRRGEVARVTGPQRRPRSWPRPTRVSTPRRCPIVLYACERGKWSRLPGCAIYSTAGEVRWRRRRENLRELAATGNPQDRIAAAQVLLAFGGGDE
jgi:hypothetical protein